MDLPKIHNDHTKAIFFSSKLQDEDQLYKLKYTQMQMNTEKHQLTWPPWVQIVVFTFIFCPKHLVELNWYVDTNYPSSGCLILV